MTMQATDYCSCLEPNRDQPGKQDRLGEGGNFSLRVIELRVLLTSELELLAVWVQVKCSMFQVGA